jgi:hypothetical protein
MNKGINLRMKELENANHQWLTLTLNLDLSIETSICLHDLLLRFIFRPIL